MSEARGLPRIGDHAPDFSAVTTQHADFNFSVWQEQHWVVFFSHPADFTPVCTTELAAFAQREELFRKRNIKLIGLSVDSIHAHLAWIQNIQDKLGVSIPFPMVADPDMNIAQLYGMIHPGSSSTVTVRAVFVIDPKRVIRALVYYPLNAGRNVDEILRLVVALQTTDRLSCSTPANWQEGEKVVVPPPKTLEEIEQSLTHTEYDRKEFYLAFKDPNKPPAPEPSKAPSAEKPSAAPSKPPDPSEASPTEPVEPDGSQPVEKTSTA